MTYSKQVLCMMMIPLFAVVLLAGCSKRLSIVKKEITPSAPFLPTALQDDSALSLSPDPSNSETVVVEDLPAIAEASAEDSAMGSAETLSIGLEDIFFDFDQAVITEVGAARLKENAAWFFKHRNSRVRIEGSTDERGTSAYNLALGERRALAIKRYLSALGVEISRIDTVSYGEERPYCMDGTEVCWSQNRRGHFVAPAQASL